MSSVVFVSQPPRLRQGGQRASGSTSQGRPVFPAASRPHARGESEGWVGCPPSAVPSPRAGKGRGPVAAPLMVALMSYRRSTPTSRVGLMAVWVRPPSAAPGEGRGRRPVAVPLRATLSFEEGEMKNLPCLVSSTPDGPMSLDGGRPGRQCPRPGPRQQSMSLLLPNLNDPAPWWGRTSKL